MIKVLNISFLVLLGLICTKVDAKTLVLNPKEDQFLSNTSFMNINATCTVEGLLQNHATIKISVLKNKGTINGKSLSGGQATSIFVHNNSTISVSADSGTQIHLTNLSSEHLKAVCSI